MKFGALIGLVVVSVVLSSCGRKAPPKPPLDAIYPMVYPPRPAGDSTIVPRDDQDPVSETRYK